jgi:hypothetical protein
VERKSLLKEVNRLLSSGLRRSAIDLIHEYLESSPNDPFVFRTLGRIYLLEKKPDQAIKYLQLALKGNQTETALDNSEVLYELDELDHEDLNYIDESSTEDGLEYAYESEDEYHSKPLNPFLLEKNDLKSGLFEEVTDVREEHNTDCEIEVISFIENNENFEFHDIEYADVAFGAYSNEVDFSLAPELDVSDDLYHDEVAAFTDFGSDLENDDIEEDFADDEIKSIEDEFDWDGLEDFDEIDEPYFLNQFPGDEIKTVGKIPRLERARQIATEVIQSYGWGIKNLPLLQQIFYENGWAAARVAIEHELSRGLTPNELELAIFVRRLWTENQQYWISFIHTTSKLGSQATRAAYKCMSWREALRIVRVFNNLPSEEEIQLFIDEIYDDWYCSQNLQKQHKAFIRYLKYRTGSVRNTLPGNELFSFVMSYEQDVLVDLPHDIIKYSRGVTELKQQGVDIADMVMKYEQKYGIQKLLDFVPDDVEDKNTKTSKKSKANIDKMVVDEDDEIV